MKKFPLMYIIILLLLTSFVFNYQVRNSYYSLLLDKIRVSTVNSVLPYLPKRQNTNILAMSIQMNKMIEKYSLTKPESAYLVFRWISENIETDCSDYEGNYESAIVAFNSGKAGFVGISNLFSILCLRLNIHTEIINGYAKIMKNADNKIYQVVEHAWNLIKIDDNSYLVDATFGAGTCDQNDYVKKFNDFYFATKPEFFVRSHYPEIQDFQLLDKPLSADEFKSIAFLRHYFYYFGLETIEPDTINLYNNPTITLNFGEEKNNLKIKMTYITKDNYKYVDFIKSTSSNVIKINSSNLPKNICGVIIFANIQNESMLYSIALYNVDS